MPIFPSNESDHAVSRACWTIPDILGVLHRTVLDCDLFPLFLPPRFWPYLGVGVCVHSPL